MKQIKLDENFPTGFTSVFEAGGIDASSVLKQNISGTDDDHLYQLCIKEKRIIVTFDLDFANIIRYPSATTSGIIVCRIRQRITLEDIKVLCEKLVGIINSTDLENNLVIVDGNKLRIRRPDRF
jgi:predicted nuclease of predicted toxin-antitoxin system